MTRTPTNGSAVLFSRERKPKFFRLLWDIVVFRSVAYLLNMITYDFYTKFYIYTFWYTFDTVLYQFLESLKFKMFRFQPITPFIFPLQSL